MSITIYEALKTDHRKLQEMLERLTNSADDSADARKALIAMIRDELVPHSRAEEALFYNSLRETPAAREAVAHSFSEHLEAEALLRALQAMDAVNINWAGVARKLRDAINHHIADEETRIFAVAQRVLTTEEAEMMAVAFASLKPEVRAEGFLKNTLDMVANMMPRRFSGSVRRPAPDAGATPGQGGGGEKGPRLPGRPV
jgi:hemerythrin-like domain-containing protein